MKMGGGGRGKRKETKNKWGRIYYRKEKSRYKTKRLTCAALLQDHAIWIAEHQE